MTNDPEITALSKVYESLKGLDGPAIKRIVSWMNDKFALDRPVAVPEPVEPVKRRRGRKPVKVPGEQVDQPVKQEIDVLQKYTTLKDLLSAADVKKKSAKVLLTAAFLQENKGLKEISSYDISSDLKKMRVFLKNISQTINNLMTKKPPLFIQVSKSGTSKQARRKFRVTEEGLKTARGFFKG